MKVVLISDNGNHHKKVIIKFWLHIFLPVLVLVVGFSVANKYSFTSQVLSSKKDNKAYENFTQVLNKLSVLDAEVQRLNTLNTYIASKSYLDIDEFGLSNQPARGGLVETNYFGSSIVRSNDIKKSVSKIEGDLEQQKLKLKNLVTSLEIKEAEEYLARLSIANKSNSNKSKTSKPTVRKQRNHRNKILYDFSTPLKKGYISSPFGERRDPINGSLRHHSGLDIATKTGSNVYAIANGFVSFSGKRGAYGNLLEVNHSESLKSRYAHLESFLVEKGQLVRKGDLIGKVGATGRVTGPHLHLEIRENNKIINPELYLNDALKNM